MPIIKKIKKNLTNQALIKESNLKTLFRLISERGSITRSELAELTDLSPTTVSSLIDELIQSGIVVCTGTSDSKSIGRKPSMLEINAKGAYIAAFGWGRKGLKYFLYDLKYNVVEHLTIPVVNSDNFIQTIYDTIINKTFRKINKRRLLALCISIPALIDSSNQVINSSVLGLRENENIVKELAELLTSIPIIIGNESVFFTYAENEFGGAKSAENLIYINISEGVGAGIMLNGSIYKGSSGMASEFGHMTIDIHGPECACGNRGCLECYLSIPAIINKYSQYAQSMGMLPAESIDEIAIAFSNNDAAAVATIHDVADILSYGICNVLYLLDIDKVIIGGSIRKLGQPFLDEVRRCMQTRAVGNSFGNNLIKRCAIYFSTLDNNASCLGAAKYFIDNIMKLSIEMEHRLFIY